MSATEDRETGKRHAVCDCGRAVDVGGASVLDAVPCPACGQDVWLTPNSVRSGPAPSPGPGEGTVGEDEGGAVGHVERVEENAVHPRLGRRVARLRQEGDLHAYACSASSSAGWVSSPVNRQAGRS